MNILHPIAALWSLVLCCVGAMGTPFACGKDHGDPPGDQPNIILFVTDDLGTDLGCYGNQVIQTPQIDRLAREGVRFSNAFCTTASCSPSRSVILSGKFNHATGQYGLAHAKHHFSSFEKLASLPRIIGVAGYRTARVGKFHVLPESAYQFDTAISGDSRNPVLMADRTRDWMAQDDQPFFLFFCTSDPHRGGGIDESDPNRPDRFGNRAEDRPQTSSVKYHPNDVIVPSYLPDCPASRAELAQYYQSVSRVDQGVGRLVEVLRESGKLDNTVILFTSDHGAAFPGAKTTLYEPGMRVPLIVFDPRQKKDSSGSTQQDSGRTTDALVSLVDLTPTILDLAGDDNSTHDFHGRSFASILRGDSTDERNTVFASHTFHEVTMYYPMRVIRTDRHKLILNLAHQLPFPFASDLFRSATWQYALTQGEDFQYGVRSVKQYVNRPRWELYDLASDPDEAVNVIGQADHSEIVADLKRRLRKFQKATSDPWQLKWERE